MANFVANTALTAAALNAAFNQADINVQTGTSYTFVLNDQGRLVTLNNAAAQTVTVPLNSSVAFPTGTVISLLSLGAGIVTVTGSAGVTITPSSGTTLAVNEAATLVKRATDTWSFVRGGFPKAVVSSSTAASTEAVTVSGRNATVYKFTGTGSITLTQGGLVDVLCQGPGGSGGDSSGGAAGAGGAGGHVIQTDVYVPSGTHVVYVGAGMVNSFAVVGNNEVSAFGGVVATGGGNGGPYRDRMPSGGACGGGSSAFAVSSARGSNFQGLIPVSAGVTRGGNGANTPSGGGGGVTGDASGGTGGAGTTPDSTWGTGYPLMGRGGGGATMAANTGNGGNINASGNSGTVLVRVYA